MESEDEDDEEDEDQAREMPEEFFVGTPQAWEHGYQKLYRKEIINGETVFFATRRVAVVEEKNLCCCDASRAFG